MKIYLNVWEKLNISFYKFINAVQHLLNNYFTH